MTIKILIVDDEPLARRRLRRMLKNDSELEIVGDCGDGREALVAIAAHAPDVVFLDIQMPEMDGFALVGNFPPDKSPHVVFVTSYDRYAIQAFEVHALDYVLKPFDRERLDRAVRHVKSLLKHQSHNQDLVERLSAFLNDATTRPDRLERIPVKRNEGVFYLRVEEIDWLEAEDNYVRLHVRDGSHLIRETLAGLEAQLDPKRFIRIQRSVIVNFDRVREIQPLFHGDCSVVLTDGRRLTLSRSYRSRFPNLPGRIG